MKGAGGGHGKPNAGFKESTKILNEIKKWKHQYLALTKVNTDVKSCLLAALAKEEKKPSSAKNWEAWLINRGNRKNPDRTN